MATYKVVNADQLDQDMTALANTIRTKGETSESLVWPAGYQAAILALETGGGAGMVSGSFTLTEATRNITIEHGLGKVPNFCALFNDLSLGRDANSLMAMFYLDTFGYTGASADSGKSVTLNSLGVDAYNATMTTAPSMFTAGRLVACASKATESSIMFGYYDGNGHSLYLNTRTYYWVLGVL